MEPLTFEDLNGVMQKNIIRMDTAAPGDPVGMSQMSKDEFDQAIIEMGIDAEGFDLHLQAALKVHFLAQLLFDLSGPVLLATCFRAAFIFGYGCAQEIETRRAAGA